MTEPSRSMLRSLLAMGEVLDRVEGATDAERSELDSARLAARHILSCHLGQCAIRTAGATTEDEVELLSSEILVLHPLPDTIRHRTLDPQLLIPRHFHWCDERKVARFVGMLRESDEWPLPPIEVSQFFPEARGHILITGHHRRRAALELGLRSVPAAQAYYEPNLFTIVPQHLHKPEDVDHEEIPFTYLFRGYVKALEPMVAVLRGLLIAAARVPAPQMQKERA